MVRPLNKILVQVSLIFLSAAAVLAQSPGSTSGTPETGAPGSFEQRIDRARALAAAHQLDSAVSELESVRKTAKDDSIQNVTSVMLVGIYLEEAYYPRAESLLEEAFQSLSSQKEGSIRNYFALAGQAVNSTRLHLARYKSFGINIGDGVLPAEAVTDLDRLRSLLERVVTQAKEIGLKDHPTYEALALLEDVIGIRASLARDNEDRAKWETEYTSARERLALSQTEVASISAAPGVLANVASGRDTRPVGSNSSGSESKVSDPESKDSTAAPAPTPEQTPSVPAEKNGTNGGQTLTTSSLNERARKKVYPPISNYSEGAGSVKVYVTIDEDGNVATVLRSEGPPRLIPPAEEAARQWKFQPTLVHGRQVRLSGYIDFDFSR